MIPLQIDPLRVFEVKGNVCQLQCASLTLTGNNQQVVAGVAGSRIRVMGWAMQSSDSSRRFYLFKSASGGTRLCGFFNAPPNTADAQQFPITISGYFETNTGEGLFADLELDIHVNVFYIVYTP